MTAGEAVTALAPIVGSGGLAGILLTLIGFKLQASKGRADPAPVLSVAVGAAIPKSADIELLANSISQLAGLIPRLMAMLEALERRHLIDDEAEKRIQAIELQRLASELRRGHNDGR